jgi:hypothetical protein
MLIYKLDITIKQFENNNYFLLQYFIYSQKRKKD